MFDKSLNLMRPIKKHHHEQKKNAYDSPTRTDPNFWYLPYSFIVIGGQAPFLYCI